MLGLGCLSMIVWYDVGHDDVVQRWPCIIKMVTVSTSCLNTIGIDLDGECELRDESYARAALK